MSTKNVKLDKKYSKFEKTEITDILIISIVLSFLFSFTFFRFSDTGLNFFGLFILFFMLFVIMFISRLYIMKLYSSNRCGIEIFLYQTKFDRYWFNKWDRLSFWNNPNNEKNKNDFKGIPTIFISIFIYILTLGFLIFPSLWNYTYRKIPYLHFGTQMRREVSMSMNFNIEVSDVRISKTLFTGFIYYIVFALLLRIIFGNSDFFYWFLLIIFWIGFFTLMPIIGSEGYELWSRDKFYWFSSFVILVIGTLSLLVFQKISYSIIIGIISIIIIIFTYFYKNLMRNTL